MAKQSRSRRLKGLFMILVLAAGVGYGWHLNRPGTDLPLYQLANVSRGDLTQVVTASGQLNPVLRVEVGSQVSGFIQKLFVDFNALVKEGQIMAQIDPATYEASVIQAEGNLAGAKAALELAQINADRAKALRTDHLIPQSEYDKVLADLHQAEATVKINQGSLQKAQVDLARCSIYSPINGVVISRNVNVGQTVAASLSAPTLFVIANDLAKMQIEAQVAEADIGQIESGQDVKFTVDAFPGQAFRGQVVQIRNAPTIEQNVVTYDTVVAVNNPSLKLKPGMTANVSIQVAQRNHILKIPNAALRFRPPRPIEMKLAAAHASTDAAAKVSQRSGRSGHKKEKKAAGRTVYVLAGEDNAAAEANRDALRPAPMKTGVSDGNFTEVIDGLREGDAVVVGMNTKQTEKRSINLFSNARKKH